MTEHDPSLLNNPPSRQAVSVPSADVTRMRATEAVTGDACLKPTGAKLTKPQSNDVMRQREMEQLRALSIGSPVPRHRIDDFADESCFVSDTHPAFKVWCFVLLNVRSWSRSVDGLATDLTSYLVTSEIVTQVD